MPKITNEYPKDGFLQGLPIFLGGLDDPARDLESVALFEDRDHDGELDDSDVRLSITSTFGSPVLPIILDVDDFPLPSLETRQFLFVVQPRRGCAPGIER